MRSSLKFTLRDWLIYGFVFVAGFAVGLVSGMEAMKQNPEEQTISGADAYQEVLELEKRVESLEKERENNE